MLIKQVLNEPKLISNWIITELIKYKDDVKLDNNCRIVKDGQSRINNNSARSIIQIVKTNEKSREIC